MTNPLSDVVERLSKARGRLSVYYMQAERDEEPNPSTLATIIDALQGVERIQGELIEDGLATIERLSAERLQLRDALEAARRTFARLTLIYPDSCGAIFLQASAEIGAIDAALSNTAEDTRHD